jgi:uncharacterized membrane protein SirB2
MACAALSISGFLLRGYWKLAGSPLLAHRNARLLPICIDTLLLLSALTLAALSAQWPFARDWLSAKLLALLVYIMLGMVALHWGRNRRQQAAGMVAAAVIFAYMVAVAVTRSVLPWQN